LRIFSFKKKVIALVSISYCKLDFEKESLEKLTQLQIQAMQKVEQHPERKCHRKMKSRFFPSEIQTSQHFKADSQLLVHLGQLAAQ
jgi:hypothetical protein